MQGAYVVFVDVCIQFAAVAESYDGRVAGDAESVGTWASMHADDNDGGGCCSTGLFGPRLTWTIWRQQLREQLRESCFLRTSLRF